MSHVTVYLGGYSFEGRLKGDAEIATKRASGVDEVANKIEVLPASPNDDRIRWDTFYRIYTDDFLSRYAPGGEFGALQDLRDERHFPGMQPVGPYAIHIIVKNGRTMLLGVVDGATDRQIAEVRAREVTGVFDVENGLSVASAKTRQGISLSAGAPTSRPPMVAARNTQVASMVLMAGTGVRGDEVLVAQAAAIVESMGATKATVDQVTVRQRETLALIKTETDDAALIKKLQDANPGADAQIAGQVRQMRSPWFRYFLDYDPGVALRKVTVPVLAINGEKDRQVIPSQNLPAIRTALAAAGNKNVEIVEFTGLNHLFQTAKTGAPGEYGDIEETMAPAVLDTIAKWVSQR